MGAKEGGVGWGALPTHLTADGGLCRCAPGCRGAEIATHDAKDDVLCVLETEPGRGRAGERRMGQRARVKRDLGPYGQRERGGRVDRKGQRVKAKTRDSTNEEQLMHQGRRRSTLA